jgi:CHAT domain-containing protein/tetratricopeptide (TPR) repeat protein
MAGVLRRFVARARRARLALALLVVALVLTGSGSNLAAGEPAAAQEDARLAEADALSQQVDQLVEQHQFDVAAAKAERVLQLRQEVLPDDDPAVAAAKSDLGALYLLLEDHGRAGKLLQDAVATLDRAKANTKAHAAAVSNLASFHDARGERTMGLALHERALAIIEQALGDDHPDVAGMMRSVALSKYRSGRRFADEAIALLRKARGIHEKAGEERGAVLDMLAEARIRRLAAKGRAHVLYQEAVDRGLKTFGAKSLAMAELWLAVAESNRREASSAGSDEATARVRKLADEQYAEAATIYREVYGERHTKLAKVYSSWALNAQAGRDIDRAVELRAKANDIEDELLATVLAGESESVKLAYLDRVRTHAEDTVSLHLMTYFHRKPHQGAARLALTTILRRKGRALDAVAENLATLQAQVGSTDRALLDELAKMRAELAAAVIRGPGSEDGSSYRRRIDRLGAKARQLEEQVASKSAAFRKAVTPVTLEAVQKAIPEDAALVEIFRMTPRDERAYSSSGEFRSPRYVAYVLRRTGKVKFAHLEKASTIDTVVRQLRDGLSDPANRRVGDPAWRLYTMTMARIRPLVGDAKRILVAPDGALNLVPFAALLGHKKFLVEDYAFSYLSSGRDLLRFETSSRAHAGPLIVADPAFDATAVGTPEAAGTRAGNLSGARFPPLPGTRQEATALGKILPAAGSLLGGDATEAALKKVAGPSILHVATHGFFLSARAEKGRGARGLELAELEALAPKPKKAAPTPKARWRIRSPLLRSGIALTGANHRRGGAEDDGILTALEATGLDLHGTQLVTLSACETGVGELVAGQGVFGLRRALVIAGADSQIMSLWKVDDEATRDLMIAYYRKLLEGKGRSEAMREVQLEMMKTKGREHPYFWAAFILSGNPGPLDLSSASGGLSGDGTAPTVPEVEPGPRGCGCRTVGRGANVHGGWLALLVSAGLGIRRRRQTGPVQPGMRSTHTELWQRQSSTCAP